MTGGLDRWGKILCSREECGLAVAEAGVVGGGGGEEEEGGEAGKRLGENLASLIS